MDRKMLVDNERLFVGDVKKCTKFKNHEVGNFGEMAVGYFEQDDETVAYNVILVKTEKGQYIDLENVYLMEALALKLIPQSSWLKMTGILMNLQPMGEGEYFVDETTLQTYDDFLYRNGNGEKVKKLQSN